MFINLTEIKRYCSATIDSFLWLCASSFFGIINFILLFILSLLLIDFHFDFLDFINTGYFAMLSMTLVIAIVLDIHFLHKEIKNHIYKSFIVTAFPLIVIAAAVIIILIGILRPQSINVKVFIAFQGAMVILSFAFCLVCKTFIFLASRKGVK